MLAEMIGTTRTQVNFFMNKFRKLGFIRYNGRLQVNNSLLIVVLHDLTTNYRANRNAAYFDIPIGNRTYYCISRTMGWEGIY